MTHDDTKKKLNGRAWNNLTFLESLQRKRLNSRVKEIFVSGTSKQQPQKPSGGKKKVLKVKNLRT